MEARPFLFLCRNDTVWKVFVDELFPASALFIAPIQTQIDRETDRAADVMTGDRIDRKSTRLNSSHSQISYAVFCLKKKKNESQPAPKRDAKLGCVFSP